MQERTKDLSYITTLPSQGMQNEEIFAYLQKNLDLGNYDSFLNYTWFMVL